MAGARWLTGGAMLACAMVASRAMASEPSAADKETSRALYAEGMTALDAADFTHAERACGGAYRLVNAPTGALCWGRALEGLGKLVEARDAYLAAAHYPSRPDEPPIFTSARSGAAAAADAVEPRIPTVVLVVSGPSETMPLRLRVDGVEIAPETARLPRKINPGRHVLLVGTEGFLASAVGVTAAEGQMQQVDIQLRPATAERIGGVSTKLHAGPTRPPSSDPSPIAYPALGVGAVGLLVGSVFGVIALSSDKNTLGKECGAPDTCPPSAKNDIETLHSHEVVADLGFGVGVVAVGLGAVLLLTSSSNAEHSEPRTASTTFCPLIGFGSLGVGGRFQ
jgi:hypothetical protein